MTSKLGLSELLATVKTLPPFPSGVAKLLAVPQGDPSYFENASAIIRADPALAGQVIRVANSALFAGQAPVDTLDRAIMRVGIRMVVGALTSSHLIKAFNPGEEGMTDIWHRNLLSAVLCRAISERAASLSVVPETAYTYGLLHDVGRLVLVSLFRNATRQLTTDHPEALDDLPELEKEYFGIAHDTAGRLIARRWKFPPEITLVIAAHHFSSADRAQYPEGINRLIDLMSLSDYMGSSLRRAGRDGADPEDAVARDLQEGRAARIAERLGIEERTLISSVEPGLRQMERQSKILGLPSAVLPTPVG